MSLTPKEVPAKLPKSLAACADLLYETRQGRLADQKVVEAQKKLESAIKEKLIAELPKGEASGISGKVARVTVVTKEIPQVKDWDKVYQFILKHAEKNTGARKLEMFALLQRRLGEELLKELWDSGVKVPGVEPFTVVDVSLNKL